MKRIKRVLSKIHKLLNIESLLHKHTIQIESSIESLSKKMIYLQRKEYLQQQVFKCSELGVTDKAYCNHEVIVSMATHGERFYEAHLAIESIMQQSAKPNRIILNVAADEFAGQALSPALKIQQSRGLEIHYCEDYWSFKKIIPTLRRFPNAIIITVDDDCLYNFDMIENMINSYRLDPNAIWGNCIHDITFNPTTNNINSYMDWNMNIGNTNEVSNLHFITSVGGVLYPPHSLHKEVLRDDIFMKICKTNDDIWCYAMMILAGTPIRKVRTHSRTGEEYLSVYEVQDSGLWCENTNFGGHFCRNDEIIKQVFEKYAIYKYIQ